MDVPEACRRSGNEQEQEKGNPAPLSGAEYYDRKRYEADDKKSAEPGEPDNAGLKGWKVEVGGRRRGGAGAGSIAASDIEGGIELGEIKAAGASGIGNLDSDVGAVLRNEIPENLQGLTQVVIRSGIDRADPDILRRHRGLSVEEREFGGLWFDEMNTVESELDWDILNRDGASCCQELTDLRLEGGPLLGREHGVRGNAKIAPLLQGEGADQELFLYLPGIEIERSAQLGRRREGVLSRNVGSECECECETGPEPTRGKVEA